MGWLIAIPGICMLIYSAFIWRNAYFFAKIPAETLRSDEWLPKVSVIIPARNEERRLPTLLNAVVNQNYPSDRLEILVVDDQSEDATSGIAKLMSTKHPNLRLIQILPEEGRSSKKNAITRGISFANGEIILQTDADCVMGPSWVRSMVAYFGANTAFVAGPVQLTYEYRMFEILQALELIGLTAIAGGSMAAGKPNMCNGANLGYRKSVFKEVNGFEGIDHVASGDDELLLQKIHRLGKYEIRYARHRKAIVRTGALDSWEGLKRQRIRWVSKARHYVDRKVNRIQMLSYLGFWSFPIGFLLGFWWPQAWVWTAGIALVKGLADYALMYQSAKFFHKLHLLRHFALLQLVYVPYVIWIGIAGNFSKSYYWKGRKVQ
ncbi:glycosyltransferase [Pontibacter sp. G13]|uniref:glycosyltransferase n=1 Tax=Pontibacter sp. G13 TaxID=3074898 RepID=UPI002889AE37|nr:glycosyltransferase [Pontibacter sp. G13]WNJ20151.1 glycosyltransferase [Pontibacter sp. G13]